MSDTAEMTPLEFRRCETVDLTQRQLLTLLMDAQGDGWKVEQYGDGVLVLARMRPTAIFEQVDPKRQSACLICLRPVTLSASTPNITATGHHVRYFGRCDCGAVVDVAVYSDLRFVQQTARMNS